MRITAHQHIKPKTGHREFIHPTPRARVVYYDENGLCNRCGLPGGGFVTDSICECLNYSA